MLRIEEPIWFYLLLIIPILIFGWYAYGRYALQLKEYFRITQSQTPTKLKLIYFIIGITLLCLAMTNPQYGYRKEKVERESADIFIALDISQSMLSEDLSPSRLDRAKKIAERLILDLKTERIGLIFFAGEAVLQMPLTTDYRTAAVFVRNASVQQAGVQGTDIADAIQKASKREDELDVVGRLLIIISDGEDHEGEAAALAKEAYEQGTTVFTVGVGTEAGGLIPMKYAGQSDYLRDQSGQPVRTKLNPTDLQVIAQAGGGLYFDHQVGNDMYAQIKEKVKRMERRNFEKTLFMARESYYQWLLLAGIIFIAWPFLLRLRRMRRQDPSKRIT